MSAYTRPARSGGFSLLEVLVAFAVLALSLGVLMNIFSGSLRNVLVGHGYAQAADVAASKLALVGAELPLENHGYSGQDEGYSWRIEILPLSLDEFAAPPVHVQAYQVVAEVAWSELGRERRFALTSLRLGAASR